MSTMVLYCWCHSNSASVLLYFTLFRIDNYISQFRHFEYSYLQTNGSNTVKDEFERPDPCLSILGRKNTMFVPDSDQNFESGQNIMQSC